MKDSLKKILKNLLIFASIVTVFLLVVNIPKHKKTGLGIDTRIVQVNFQEGSIVFEDVTNFELAKPLLFPYNFSYFSSEESILSSNVEVSHNGIVDYYYTSTSYFIMTDEMLNTLKINSSANISTKVTYRVKNSALINHAGVNVLSFTIDARDLDYLNKFTMIINEHENIANIEVDDATITKTDGKYYISLENLKKSVTLDIRITPVIPISTPNLQGEASYKERFNILICIFAISIIAAILGIIINKTPKATEYRRDTVGLDSAVLAEFIIDKKVNLKNLIMTAIIEASVKGNVKIINNKTIQLVSREGLSYIERQIVNMLFGSTNTEITFSDINKMFARSNKDTTRFSHAIKDIRENIASILISTKMFNNKLSFISSFLRILAIIMCLLLPLLFINVSYITDIVARGISIFTIILFTTPKYVFRDWIYVKSSSTFTKVLSRLAIILILITYSVIFSAENLSYITYTPTFFIIMAITFLVNIFTIIKCKGIVLSKEGNAKLVELLKLKKYIDEHSLIKNRDLHSAIIWDKYLAYATAFGIPNAVTNSIYENWYNLNITLQIIASPLGF